MRPLLAFNFQEWIDRHRQDLQPPVNHRAVFHDSDFIIMVVGGPNSRTDYHDDPGDEFFYQLQGNMVLKTIQGGKPVDVPIRQGEILLLPAHVPHSPQRFANTVGLVIERRRLAHEKDGFLWYCENCHSALHAEYVHVADIEVQLPQILAQFNSSQVKRTCKNCGHVAAAR